MSALTILSVAYPLSPVSVDSVGGAEQIVASLDRAIVQAGHRSIVIANERSRVEGELVGIFDPGDRELDAEVVARVHDAAARAIGQVLRAGGVDLVHMHGVDFDRYLPLDGPPVVATLHLPIAWYARDALRPLRPDVHLCCVSASQARDLPSWAAASSIVDNGISLGAFRPSAHKRGFALALGRLCEEKGLHEALDAADLAGVPLIVAGEASHWGAHRRYFEERFAPRLRPPHRWIGPIGLARKRRLLAAARCLLVPSRVPETSSLVAMEALASGTPVIAYPSGALANIVEHGTTGFLVDDADGMARAIACAADISPEQCRHAAESQFSAAKMTRSYLALYERTIEESNARRSAPPPRALTVDVVEGPALFELAPEWARLWKRCPWATPFQRPEWLLAYARVFHGGTGSARAWAITVRSGGELVGLAPLRTESCDGRATITLLGQGISDYLDVLARPDIRQSVIERMVDALGAYGHAGATLVLDALRPGSPLLEIRAPSKLEERAFDREPSPVVSLAGKVDPLPKTMRDKLRYYRRRGEALGRLELHEAPGNADFPSWLERVIELHGARWAGRGEPGVLATPEVQRFHREATSALAEVGLARVYGLSIGETNIAAMLLLRDARSHYYYIGGFAPEYEAISPGTILIGHAVDRARGEGATEIDFLRGREDYKYRFGAEDRANRGRTFTRRGSP